MKHKHQWKTISFWALTLPDIYGYYDAFLAWECVACHQEVWSTGTFHQTAQAMSPDVWQQVADQERRKRTALTRAAQQQERIHVAAQDKYTVRFQTR